MRHGVRAFLAALLVAVLAACGSASGAAPGAPAEGPTPALVTPAPPPTPSPTAASSPAATPGSLVDATPETTPLPARATRILYRSTDTAGAPIEVSGTVFLPLAPPPGPLRLVGYAVGTQGMADRCAPSVQFPAGSEYEATGVAALLDRGYAVAVTDYQGLGTPGEHTYVNRAAEGHAVLDAVRAATALPGGVPPGGPVGLAGYSQGGGASAAAAELAPTYAPELRLVGAYAGAVPADLAAVGAFLDGTPSAGLIGYSLTGLDAAYPGLDVGSVLNDAGRAFLADTAAQCIGETSARYAGLRTDTLTADGRPLADVLAAEPFRARVAEQHLGTVAPRAPVLVAHSVDDDVVPFAQDGAMVDEWCAAGATVTFVPLPVAGHVAAATPAFAEGLAFLDARFAGVPPGTTCRRP